MKAIILLIGIGILTFGTAGCEWGEHEHHEHSGGAYDGYYQGYGHGEYPGYPDYYPYHH
jgi:hypothetical protein